jgi:hypothetical protein
LILLCGIPSEPPLAMVAAALASLNKPYIIFNQREFKANWMRFNIDPGRFEITGWLEVDGRGIKLGDLCGVYTRLMDYQALPELKDEPIDTLSRLQCAALHDTLINWLEITPARVVNRMGAMGSNGSKPYQAQLIREHGFEIPETLITNNTERVLAFRKEKKRLIYKSISGVRSIVHEFEDDDLERLERIRWLPTQFQEYIEGNDVRVHVVNGRVFATIIQSAAIDYRYAQSIVGQPAMLSVFELPDEIAEHCIELTRSMGLVFTGIDLRITPDNRVYCFEVNPCPGFSYYEANTGQPIAEAVAQYLAGDG